MIYVSSFKRPSILKDLTPISHSFFKCFDALKSFSDNKITKFIRKTVDQLKTKTTPAIVKHYGGKGDAIPIEKYKEAMSTVYSTLGNDKKKIEEAIERDIEISKENAAHTFTSAAKNSFTSSQSKLTKKASGPSARQ